MASFPDYATLAYEERDGVAWVTLNRPERHNAFNSLMQRELHDCWRTLRWRESVRCVVLTGAGEKAFCTGIDRMEQMGGDTDDTTDADVVGSRGGTPFHFNDPGDNIGPKSSDLWKPVIAAVNGMACGGAFYMLGETEFIIAADNATFFDPHVTYGMTAAYEPIQMLNKMPFPEVMRMSLLGVHERMTAERAREIGLVTEVAPLAELRERAGWAARVIADSPALAVQGTLRALWAGLELSRTQAIEMATMFIRVGTDAGAFEEGQARFASGVRPQWRSR
jgi:enoyl-CoA hydratase/carnithine racemase